jgi:hypothetical protein
MQKFKRISGDEILAFRGSEVRGPRGHSGSTFSVFEIRKP